MSFKISQKQAWTPRICPGCQKGGPMLSRVPPWSTKALPDLSHVPPKAQKSALRVTKMHDNSLQFQEIR